MSRVFIGNKKGTDCDQKVTTQRRDTEDINIMGLEKQGKQKLLMAFRLNKKSRMCG